MRDLTDPNVLKTAFNANFERTCIGKHFAIACDPLQWRCTAVHALMLGLPTSLDEVAKELKLDAQKDQRGKNLIKYFSVPCKPTQTNGERTRNYPHHAPDKWQTFVEYCRQDVIVEREIARKLGRFPIVDREWRVWSLDQRINDGGIRLDQEMCQRAIAVDDQYKTRLEAEARELTKLDNPNSLPQLKVWLAEHGLDTPDGLGKEYMPGLIEASPSDEVRRALELRQGMSKTSVDKYHAMARSVCADGRIRGVFQFYGASRTGRWAGRIFQPHNLPKNLLNDIDLARETLVTEDADWLEMMYGSPSFVLSQLIRTALVPDPGHVFLVADFSAIEARITAWLADEKWVLDVFRSHGKIYEATASQMFNVPFETITKGHANYKYRPFGKVATLACGFQGSAPAMARMDYNHEIDPDEYPRIVQQWRDANPNIRRLWYRAQDAAVKAVREKTTVPVAHGVRYRYEAGILFADLPSGRSLAYLAPEVKPDPKFGTDGIVFSGLTDEDGKSRKWGRQRTYGGRLVENMVQAIARDCLAENMMRLDDAGYRIAMHVHDEVVLEVPEDQADLNAVSAIMGHPISWAPGLPLRADGFVTDFYRKD